MRQQKNPVTQDMNGSEAFRNCLTGFLRTAGRVFSQLNPEESGKAFLKRICEAGEITGGQIAATDGRTLRRSYGKSSDKAAVRMVSALAPENRLIPGRIKTEEKSDGITAVPGLPGLPEIQGCIATFDATGCQKGTACRITDGGADYIPALRGNHGNLYKDAGLFSEDARQRDFGDIPFGYYGETDGGHGRAEARRFRTAGDIGRLSGKENRKGPNIIGTAEPERHMGNKISTEIRYYISGTENNAEKFGAAVRGHRGNREFCPSDT